jgi:hypothetical protein
MVGKSFLLGADLLDQRSNEGGGAGWPYGLL